MQPPANGRKRALFVSPEKPGLGMGGGALRSESLLQYLRRDYDVDIVTFTLREHSKSLASRVTRNAIRLLKNAPPLFDRYSGYEDQLPQGPYDLAVVEHFWCASYADALRTRASRLVLDLHNIESELAATHARSVTGPKRWASERFAAMYRSLEQEWLPKFDTLLVTSDADRARLIHPDIRLFPNGVPRAPLPSVAERAAVVFSGNLEYHPNIEAVRWFARSIWPGLSSELPRAEWRLIGRNAHAIAATVHGLPNTTIVGPVDDAISAIAEGRVCVVPLLSGSGTRFKILEAWAAGRAVVSTTLGAEGLGAIHGEHLLVADSAAEFTQAILRVWKDDALRLQLAQAGRARYEQQFTWDAVWRHLDDSGGV